MSEHLVYRRSRLVPGRPAGAIAETWGTIVTPDELVNLLGLTAEEAARASELVQITIEAYCWPTVVPEPIPPPMHAVGLALAARFSGASLSKSGSVVSETVGSFSYRLASPLTFDSVVMALGDELAQALSPWAPRHSKTYTLDLAPGLGVWPADYWQRDLDRLVNPL